MVVDLYPTKDWNGDVVFSYNVSQEEHVINGQVIFEAALIYRYWRKHMDGCYKTIEINRGRSIFYTKQKDQDFLVKNWGNQFDHIYIGRFRWRWYLQTRDGVNLKYGNLIEGQKRPEELVSLLLVTGYTHGRATLQISGLGEIRTQCLAEM